MRRAVPRRRVGLFATRRRASFRRYNRWLQCEWITPARPSVVVLRAQPSRRTLGTRETFAAKDCTCPKRLAWLLFSASKWVAVELEAPMVGGAIATADVGLSALWDGAGALRLRCSASDGIAAVLLGVSVMRVAPAARRMLLVATLDRTDTLSHSHPFAVVRPRQVFPHLDSGAVRILLQF